MLQPEPLRQRARTLLRDLRQPSSTFLKPLMMRDPLGIFRRFLEDAQRSQPEIPTRDGQMMSSDGRFALVMLATVHSHFASDIQAAFLDDLHDAFSTVQAEFRNRLTIESSGANRVAVQAEESIKRDVYRIGGVTCLGVAALFVVFFRSPIPFFLAMLPALFGMLAGITISIAVLGGLDGLSIAFGAALIGVAVDYSIHVINHHALLGTGDSAQTVRRLAPSLLLGAATTMASFAGLLMTSSPAIRELGFLAITGIGVAIATTLLGLPAFLGARSTVPEISRQVARALHRAVDWLDDRRRALLIVTLLLAGAGLLALPRLTWVDDLSQLGNVDRKLIEEDVRVRSRLPVFETGRFVITLAPDVEQALQRNDVVHERLARLVDSGSLGGVRSLHQLLWSRDLQLRNLELLRRHPVRELVDAAYRQEGFRAGAFDAAFDDLQSPPPPLELEDLRSHPALAPLLSTLAMPIGDETAIITYLRDIRSLPEVEAALADLDGVVVFDQRTFVNQVYAEFRTTSLEQILVGTILVAIVLMLRYRSWRPALASVLPSLLVVVVLLGGFASFGVETNLLHVISLMMVMGMGVDYGIFLVDTHADPEAFGSTLLSLLLACLTTVFVFGALGISEHPALRAMGMTTGFGVLLAFLFAPVSLLLTDTRQRP
jgi:predicted exporter